MFPAPLAALQQFPRGQHGAQLLEQLLPLDAEVKLPVAHERGHLEELVEGDRGEQSTDHVEDRRLLHHEGHACARPPRRASGVEGHVP